MSEFTYPNYTIMVSEPLLSLAFRVHLIRFIDAISVDPPFIQTTNSYHVGYLIGDHEPIFLDDETIDANEQKAWASLTAQLGRGVG